MYKTGILSGFFCSNRRQYNLCLFCQNIKINNIGQYLSIFQLLHDGLLFAPIEQQLWFHHPVGAQPDKPYYRLRVCISSPGQADIVTFGVLPDYRGRHISDELMTASFDSLAAKGIKEIFLEVAVDNVHAIALYERHGFKRVGLRPNYYVRGDVKTDALVMRAEL